MAALPADPDALLSQIRHDTKDSGQDLATFGQIVHILNEDKLIPPTTNAAIYRALAKIPGVKVVTGAKDFAGRPGIAVTRTAQGLREELILDGTTYRFLGVQTSGRIASATADLDWRVVDRPGQR